MSADRHPHGARARYALGCRCLPCRASNSRYECERWAAAKRGERRVVPADAARAHLLALARAGIGKLAVAAASDVAPTTVWKIRSGRLSRVLRTTEARLLAVTVEARADHSGVPAGPTLRLVAALVEEGFTRKALASKLGFGRSLQFLYDKRRRVSAKTAARIERFARLHEVA